MNQALRELYERNLITLKDAMVRSPNRDEFHQMLGTTRAADGGKGGSRRAARGGMISESEIETPHAKYSKDFE